MLNFGNKEFRNLQEQVLENAKNIEILKERPTLKPVVVQELPAVGEVNILYLVPKNPDPDTSDADSYDEYVWLPETQTYEFVGSTALNLQQLPSPIYVTTENKPEGLTYGLRIGNNGWTSEIQQEDGAKIELTGTSVKVNTPIELGTGMSIKNHDSTNNDYIDLMQGGYRRFTVGNTAYFYTNVLPAGSQNLGSATTRWVNVWCNKINLGTDTTNLYIAKDASDRIGIYHSGAERIKIGTETSTYCAANWTPDQNATYDLGTNGLKWKDLYLTGNISDGVNSVAVANIASKVTSTFISGTFDTNGESTIDTEQAGTPEGLFIFTYGNCQCFLRLTAAMVNSADIAPIRVSCPMIYNGATSLGWLNITKAGTILVLKVTDGTNHVDSGYAWTLTKTNLL